MSDTLIHRRVAAAREGTNPAVIRRMSSGWAVVGDRQVVHGYCLLLPDPVVPDLNALSPAARSLYLLDMAALGDALLQVTGATRINYEILGNSEPALHAHLFPRYQTEPEEFRTGPVWHYDWSKAPAFDRGSYAAFIEAVCRALTERDRSHFTPAGWHAVTPRIVVHEAEQLVAFVKHVFGATGDYRPDMPAVMRIGDSIVMISDAGIREPSPAFLYVYVADTDETYRRALGAGARSLEEPCDLPYGDRRGMVEDKWGNTWQIATHLGGAAA
jgi:uncharacterized glyoxalase superfamily protein PhnB/diadenosine tetraphosphate (Ap4A) HIT family hydrolase